MPEPIREALEAIGKKTGENETSDTLMSLLREQIELQKTIRDHLQVIKDALSPP